MLNESVLKLDLCYEIEIKYSCKWNFGCFFLNRIKMEFVLKWFFIEDLIYVYGNNDMCV